MKIIITGAAGFVGAALSHYFIKSTSHELVLVDRSLTEFYSYKNQPRIRLVEGELQNPLTRINALDANPDVLIHLAALPGGAAEENPVLSKLVNLNATLALAEEFSLVSSHRRFVFVSTIAVLGTDFSHIADDHTPLAPTSVYGTHKAMVELALADMARRGTLDPISLRLPGIVARPETPSGLKSAFVSNVFHVLKRNEPFVFPMSGSATTWLMSLGTCISNVVRASNLANVELPISRAITLRAVHCRVADLGSEISDYLGVSRELISFDSNPILEAMFGRYPPQVTSVADQAGFITDFSLRSLIHSVYSNIKETNKFKLVK